MTPPKDQQAPEDPLAAFRAVTDDRYPDTGEPATEQEADAPEVGHAIVTQEVWDQARAQMVAGWHADTVSLGFLHKGGNCGCHYLAGVALTASMPVEPEPELETQEA